MGRRWIAGSGLDESNDERQRQRQNCSMTKQNDRTCPNCWAHLVLALPPDGKGQRKFQCCDCDRATGAHDQADRDAGDQALRVFCSFLIARFSDSLTVGLNDLLLLGVNGKVFRL
jgi:hypothetical protein